MEFSICGESETLESVTHGNQMVTAQTILFVKQSKVFVISSTHIHMYAHKCTCKYMYACVLCMYA